MWINSNFLSFKGRIGEVIKRFPLVVMMAIVTTITIILVIDFNETGKIIRYPIVAFTAFLAMLNLAIYNEAYRISKRQSTYILITILALLIAYYFSIPDDFTENYSCFWIFVIGINFILHILVSLIPYLHRPIERVYNNYNVSVFIAWMQASLYGILIFIALSLAITAFDNLFDIKFKYTIYLKLFVLIIGLIQPIFFLSDFPNTYRDEKLPEKQSILKTILAYIFVPVSIIYLLIINAYLIKWLINDESIVDWLFIFVIWYFIVGILGWLLCAYYESEEPNAWLDLFRKWFFPASIPPLVLFMISLYQNIAKNGINEGLYFSTFIAGIVLLSICYFVLFGGKDKRFLPILLILVTVIICIKNPFSLCQLPIQNQKQKLIQNLEKKGIIKNGIIDIDTSLVYFDTNNVIIDRLRYLDSRNELIFLKEMDQNGIIPQKKDSLDAYQIFYALGLQYVNNSDNNYGVYLSERSAVDIADYQSIIPIILTDDAPISEIKPLTCLLVNGNNIRLFIDNKEISKVSINQDLLGHDKEITDKFHIMKTLGNYDVKLLIYSVYGTKNGSTITLNDLQGICLLKEKSKG